MNRVLVDTGPLVVAILSPRDQFHDACTQALKELAPPLYTCWPVLTEAACLLRFDSNAVGNETDGIAIAAILSKYRRLKPQLADAALVHLASREDIDTVFTLDRRDFLVYRRSRNRVFRIVP